MEALKEQDFLVSQIELKRKEMILSATNTGFGSKQTLTLSKELDQL
ncbi:MAG TPA: aspartyl-phosphate phosphatase Spo0E family protein, partial [Bacillales bacterium]|nr:aspartyl-phosphate phosphatase Spo0E family protein [Bacillales bacterium]